MIPNNLFATLSTEYMKKSEGGELPPTDQLPLFVYNAWYSNFVHTIYFKPLKTPFEYSNDHTQNIKVPFQRFKKAKSRSHPNPSF